MQFVIFNFRFKFYFNLWVLVRFLSWNWQPVHFAICEKSFLWLQIIINKYTGQWLKRVERVGRTLYQEILNRFRNNFDFVPPMINNTKAIIWLMDKVYRKYFQVDLKSIFIECVRPTQIWLILWIPLTSKWKAYLSIQWITT